MDIIKNRFPQFQKLVGAVLAGDPHACYRLACLCLEGKFPPYHRELAIPLLERAAAKGHAEARERLLLETSSARQIGSGQDAPPPLEELTDRAEQGEAQAQYLLARRYALGDGVRQHWGEAAHWYQKAALNGNALSQFSLDHCFRQGKGVATNAAACAYWFRQSAEQGLADGQCNIGWCYGTAFGVPLSYHTARHWYALAAAQGHELARRNSLAVQQAFARVFASCAVSLEYESFSIASDRTLEVNRRKCCIYIRDQYKSYLTAGGTSSYRYHLCDCCTIREMTARGKRDRYIATARDDGLFPVTPLHGPNAGREKSREISLALCRNCRSILQEQGMYTEPFSLRAFYAGFQTQLPQWTERLEQQLVEDGDNDARDPDAYADLLPLMPETAK